VDVGTSLSLITKRNQRTDGSTISPDVITIGAEGATTVIGVTGTGALTAASLSVTGATTLGVTGTGALTAASLSVTGNSYFYTNTINNDSSRDIIINSIIAGPPVSSPAIVWNNNYYPGIKLVYRSKSWQNSFIAFETTGKVGDTTTSIAPTITDKALCINTYTGFVGIGTTTPVYPLHVVGTASGPSRTSPPYDYTFFEVYNGFRPSQQTTQFTNMCIFTEGSILAYGGFYAASDRRIKSNIVDIEDDRALRDLRLLKPKTYTYKDVVEKGYIPVYGFIAQEVKEVLNYASSPITKPIPNVYELATFSGDILTLTFNTSDLSRDASGALFPRLKLNTREGKEEFVNILEIIDEHTLRVDKDLTSWGGEFVGDQIVPGNRISVYGQEVSDFHTLNKDAIWTVATAALQEVDRQLQAEKQKTALMQTALDALLERVNALEQKNSV
jgi:hypothetical protein